MSYKSVITSGKVISYAVKNNCIILSGKSDKTYSVGDTIKWYANNEAEEVTIKSITNKSVIMVGNRKYVASFSRFATVKGLSL